MNEPNDVYARILEGDFQPARQLLAHEPSHAGGWTSLLGAADWFVNDERPAPDFAAISDLKNKDIDPSSDALALGARACFFPALDAFLSDEKCTFDQWLGLMGDLVGNDPSSGLQREVAEQWLAAVSLFDALAQDPFADDLVQRVAALRREAVELRDSALLVTASAQSALIALAHGEVDDATTFARRASRIAASEGWPQFEYLANWVLARVRRSSGRPYLATRIARILRRISQPRWHALLTWELIMAGRVELARESLSELAEPYRQSSMAKRCHAFACSIEAAKAGDSPAFEQFTAQVSRDTWTFSPHSREANAVLAALDPTMPPHDVPPDAAHWVTADTDETPPALFGFVPPPDKAPSAGVAGAMLYARPDGHTRRVLLDGVSLTEPDTSNVPASLRGKGRVEHAACVLLAHRDDGIPKDELFRLVYGFGIDPGLHEAAFISLMHRVRSALEDAGDVRTESGRCQVSLRRGVLVPDTRCHEAGDQILRVLAKHGKLSAKDASRILGVPLRTVQATLQLLSQEGACVVEREGRKVRYLLEDTTFHEPTLAT